MNARTGESLYLPPNEGVGFVPGRTRVRRRRMDHQLRARRTRPRPGHRRHREHRSRHPPRQRHLDALGRPPTSLRGMSPDGPLPAGPKPAPRGWGLPPGASHRSPAGSFSVIRLKTSGCQDVGEASAKEGGLSGDVSSRLRWALVLRRDLKGPRTLEQRLQPTPRGYTPTRGISHEYTHSISWHGRRAVPRSGQQPCPRPVSGPTAGTCGWAA